MKIPRVKGQRREVRRMLAEHSRRLLYLMMAVAAWLVWRQAPYPARVSFAMVLNVAMWTMNV